MPLFQKENMMRIEGPQQVIKPTYNTPICTDTECRFLDTIRYGKDTSCVWRTFSTIRRKISNFFRWILSFCLPVKPRAPVHINEIECKKKEEKEGISDNWILLNGTPTKNEIKFKKVGDYLQIEELAFPDEEMQEHIGTILDRFLKEEKAKGFTTQYLETAKILWSAGFKTKDKISLDFNEDGPKETAINNIIDKAWQEKNKLNQHSKDALDRIWEIKVEKADELYDSLIGSIVCIGSKQSTIALSDLLTVMEAIDVGSRRGISLGADNFVKFKITDAN